MKRPDILFPLFLLLSCSGAIDPADNPVPAESPVPEAGGIDLSPAGLARLFSELPIRAEHLKEVHDAVGSSSGNGYDEESISAEGNLMGRAHVDFLTEEKPTRITSDAMNVEIDYNDRRLPVRSKETVLNSLCEMQWETGLDDYPERFYTYEYDERGNWISRAERVHPDSAAVVVLRRTIKYQK